MCIGACFGLLCGGCCCCIPSFDNNEVKNKTGVISRLPYIALFILSSVVGIFLYLYEIPYFSSGNGSDAPVYVISFWLLIFEIIHVIVIAAGVISFHWLCFIIKFLVYAIVVALFLYYDDTDTFFNGYATDFARYISAIYLLIQVLLLITWAYETNDRLKELASNTWVEPPADEIESLDTAAKENESNNDRKENDNDDEVSEAFFMCNSYLLLLVGSSFAIYFLSFLFMGLFFGWYASDASCSLHKTLIILTIVFAIFTVYLNACAGNGSFFVSSVVVFYSTYLLYCALQSSTDSTCNQFSEVTNTVTLWVGSLLIIFSISYAALRAEKMVTLFTFTPPEMGDTNEQEYKPLLYSEDEKVDVDDGKVDADDDTKKDDDDDGKMKAEERMQIRKEETYFHVILMMAACYICMVLTNWSSSGTNTGTISTWVNMGCQWVTFLLYWQTLIAPFVCPGRFEHLDVEEEENF